MKILVVGSGGREHAIVRKLKDSPQVEAVYCAPGNGGISRDAECFPVNAMDKEGMLALAKEKAVDLVFVARGRTPTVKSTEVLRHMERQLKAAGVLQEPPA